MLVMSLMTVSSVFLAVGDGRGGGCEGDVCLHGAGSPYTMSWDSWGLCLCC